ncbi:hypothetical protein HELRODRAFT_71299 [Helobdella robusta]|uniref:RING-type E3 ubiquitin transferase n=1 Tax=Helobdella robusta TaxID=6412 RepID=T1G0J3_HELRO|nr:hypothetical protein HELRODRAFT_71299 [Helobdella robusta]ESO11559.1 hypothetical protein HELRODRAFT_71299 [Helobdella robusta]
MSKNRIYKLPFIRGMFIDNCCRICLEDFQNKSFVSELKCRHSFHFDCIKEWFNGKSSCPTCRSEISSSVTIRHSYEVTKMGANTCIQVFVMTLPQVRNLTDW